MGRVACAAVVDPTLSLTEAGGVVGVCYHRGTSRSRPCRCHWSQAVCARHDPAAYPATAGRARGSRPLRHWPQCCRHGRRADTQSETSVAAESARPARIGLVLSGGGARGAAHVGVIRALEEIRIPVDAVARHQHGPRRGRSVCGGSQRGGDRAHLPRSRLAGGDSRSRTAPRACDTGASRTTATSSPRVRSA